MGPLELKSVLIKEMYLLQNVVGTLESVLIIEVSLFQSVLIREVPSIFTFHCNYTYSRLLSGLPKEGMLESSDDSKLKDLEEFGYWMKHWGGGKKGWTMAQTRQKLKDAQRLGTKQTKWQQ